MTDIVKRLRNKWKHSEDACYEAADEIERLRAEVARCEASLLEWIEAVGECNEDRNRLRAALREAHREGFLAALEMAERRCEDAARYVRLRARSGEDHTVASTYEQAGAMVRALPVPDAFRAPTGLEYRGG